MLSRARNQLRIVSDAEFSAARFDIAFHHPRREREPFGDQLGGLAIGDQTDDGTLSLGKICRHVSQNNTAT